MRLRFKKGSAVSKAAIALYEQKENTHKQAIKIIEEVTGCKTLENSQLGYSWCFDWSYSWRFDKVYFEKGLIDVPGYIHKPDESGNDHHIVNKRKKTIYSKLRERFQKEVPDTSIKPLYEFGIKNEAELTSYNWRLYKEENGEIVMNIHPGMYDLIDFSKSVENTEQTVFVEQ